jgi:uncharacterized membrane protein YdjX (TVP38/TMEM64 family)
VNTQKTLRALLAGARSRDILIYVATGLALVGAIVAAGEDIARHIATLEIWTSGMGPGGVFAFIALLVVATSLLIPESVLSIIAGGVFGFRLGLIAVLVGNVLAASLQYALARQLLRGRIERALAGRPALAAIQRAVRSDELRLQALLRLTPLNPATVSYLLGAAGVRFPGFLAASLALTPHLLLEVYVGFAGKHLAHMAGRGTLAGYLHDVTVIGGLAVTIIVIGLLSRTANRAVMATASADPDDADP